MLHTIQCSIGLYMSLLSVKQTLAASNGVWETCLSVCVGVVSFVQPDVLVFTAGSIQILPNSLGRMRVEAYDFILKGPTWWGIIPHSQTGLLTQRVCESIQCLAAIQTGPFFTAFSVMFTEEMEIDVARQVLLQKESSGGDKSIGRFRTCEKHAQAFPLPLPPAAGS